MYWKRDLEWQRLPLRSCKTGVHHWNVLLRTTQIDIRIINLLQNGYLCYFSREIYLFQFSFYLNSCNMSNFDHPTERGFTDLLLRQRVWFKLCIWLWKWLWECRRKCHKDMPGKQSLEWGKHQLYRYWHITKFLFFAWGYDTWLTDKQRSKQESTTTTKIKKKSLHQNCENPLAKGFLTSTISSNDTEGVHIRTSIITSFCFSFLIIWFFFTYRLVCQIFFLHRLMSHVQPVLW